MPKVTIIPQASLTTGQIEVSPEVAKEADQFLAELRKKGDIKKNGNGHELRIQFSSDRETEEWVREAKVHYLTVHKLNLRKLPDTAAGQKKLAPFEHRYQLTPYVAKENNGR